MRADKNTPITIPRAELQQEPLKTMTVKPRALEPRGATPEASLYTKHNVIPEIFKNLVNKRITVCTKKKGVTLLGGRFFFF